MSEEQKDSAEETLPVFTLDQCPKKPDNPLFAEEKRKQQDYIDGLQQQVDYLRMKDPAKYQKYQAIGESLMDCTYEPISGVDVEGDNMTAQRLLYVVRDYGKEELSEEELNFLVRVYGRDWNERLEEL